MLVKITDGVWRDASLIKGITEDGRDLDILYWSGSTEVADFPVGHRAAARRRAYLDDLAGRLNDAKKSAMVPVSAVDAGDG